MTLNDSKNLKSKQLEETLSEIKHKEEETQAKQLAEKLDLPYLNLTITPIDPNDLAILPKEKSQMANLLIIKKSGRILNLAAKDPNDPKTQEIIKELQGQGFEYKLFIASPSSLKKGWERYEMATSHQKDAPIRGVFNIKKEELEEFKKSLKTIQDLQKAVTGLSTSRLLAIIMAGAIEMEASDIHLEPSKENIRLRYRIDGLLQDITTFPNKEYHFLVSRIKTLSDLLLNVTDVSQDGRFTTKISDEQEIDLRVSILPTSHGQSIVMRLLGMATVELSLEGLGIRPELFEVVKKQIDQPNGMILTTGPTGSGKTTTLYACLNYVNKPGTKIITVEDPVEYQLKGVTQTPISQRKGQTFAKSLKSIVRQDPDVLMMGEIRDPESAQIAVEFALTGHLVFSTIHTNEAAGAITRFLSLEVSPDSLASSINLIMAQRLIRKLCSDCKEKYKTTPKELKMIKQVLGSKTPKKIPQLYKAKGCDKCHGLGYQGRIGVFEFLNVTEEIKKLILNKRAAFELRNKAQEQGMVTLIQDALLRAIEGQTSLEEVARVVGSK